MTIPRTTTVSCTGDVLCEEGNHLLSEQITQEPCAFLCPYQIGGSDDLTITARNVLSTGARESHACILGVGHILPALAIEDAEAQETAIELEGCHVDGLGNLRGSEAVDTLEALPAILRIGFKFFDLLRELLVLFRELFRLNIEDDESLTNEFLFVKGNELATMQCIAAMLADSGQNF